MRSDDLIARLRAVAIRPDIGDIGLFEAADALEAKDRRIAELEAQTKSAEACCDSYATENQQFHDRIEAQAARIAELKAVLKHVLSAIELDENYAESLGFGRAAYLGEKE